jgi:hypothetical protein
MKEKSYSRDFKVTAIVIVIFGLPAALFNMQDITDRFIWLAPSWIQSLCILGLSYLFAWGTWWRVLAVIVAALNLSLENYWKWSVVSFLGVVILNAVGDHFRTFGFVFDVYSIIAGITAFSAISGPWVIVSVISIFWIKKLIRTINRGE